MHVRRLNATLVAGLAAMTMALTACSGNREAPSSGTEEDDGAGELSFFSWDNEATMTPLIEAFEKADPEISIEFSYAPPVQEYQDTLQRRLQRYIVDGLTSGSVKG